jgi:hypothetical protein
MILDAGAYEYCKTLFITRVWKIKISALKQEIHPPPNGSE